MMKMGLILGSMRWVDLALLRKEICGLGLFESLNPRVKNLRSTYGESLEHLACRDWRDTSGTGKTFLIALVIVFDGVQVHSLSMQTGRRESVYQLHLLDLAIPCSQTGKGSSRSNH